MLLLQLCVFLMVHMDSLKLVIVAISVVSDVPPDLIQLNTIVHCTYQWVTFYYFQSKMYRSPCGWFSF